MAGGEIPERVLEGKQRVVGANCARRLTSHLGELAQHFLKTLIRVFGCSVGAEASHSNLLGSLGVMTRISSAASISSRTPKGSSRGVEAESPAAIEAFSHRRP